MPFLVTIEGEQKYLFQASKYLTLKKVLDIEAKFLDNELAFFTTDPNYAHKIWAKDAANVYEVGDRGIRPLYFKDDNQFWESKRCKREYEGGWHYYFIIQGEQINISQ